MRALVCWLLLAACGNYDSGKGGGGGESKAVAAGGPGAREAVLEAWKRGELAPEGLTPATVAFGKDCQSGAVANIDVLICAYAAPAEAKAAEAGAYAWVGGTTGAVVVSGAALVAISDRRKADPNGRTINRLMKLVPRAPAEAKEAKEAAEAKGAAEPKEAKEPPAAK